MDEKSSENSVVNGRLRYIHEKDKSPPEAIDIHHIIVQRNRIESFILRFSAPVLLAIPSFLFFLQGLSISLLLWGILLVAVVVLLLQKLVEKGHNLTILLAYATTVSFIFLFQCPLKHSESVIILPAFGVQLETHYGSGRTIRRFVPISKILKPVINECVTPVTCFWSLSLIIRGEEELMLVFKELYPPLRMLVPVWKALCATTDRET